MEKVSLCIKYTTDTGAEMESQVNNVDRANAHLILDEWLNKSGFGPAGEATLRFSFCPAVED